MGLSFFKKAKVENMVDIESTMVQLPKSKKEFTIAEIVNRLDVIENMHGYANDDHMVKCGNEEMTVKDLVKKHMENESAKEEAKKAADSEKENSEASLAEDEKDAGDRGCDKALNAEKSDMPDDSKEDEKKKNAIEKAKALKNAAPKFSSESVASIDLPSDQLKRGRELF